MTDSSDAKAAGRVVGALTLFQLAGLIVPFVLVLPLAAGGLVEAASHAQQVRAAVLLLFANGVITLGIAITLFTSSGDGGRAWSLWLLAASVAWLAVQTVDGALLMGMLSLGEPPDSPGASGAAAAPAAGAAFAAVRRWTHHSVLLIVEWWFLLFYGALLRRRLVPRALAALGLAMACVHAGAVGLPAFLGLAGAPVLAPSLALSQVATGGWLLARGFPDRSTHRPPDTPARSPTQPTGPLP